jgi:hypothetical protein
MNERIEKLAVEARQYAFGEVENSQDPTEWSTKYYNEMFEQKFAELIVRECIDKIETYRIPVGNSAAGEMACEWTYDALKEIRDEIKEHFGVES